ncbi:IclR family transcriptional regulator C-terminal domain-containing protein [Streptomyces violaceusniger]|uniref:IclR family transcriptional regulator domain-containing protein n=1 Tax=Streptomyces violaceusniger TaxID=68280 RepID=UPI0038116D47
MRERGYAADDACAEQDVRAIAAPVLGPGDRVAGAVGIVGLTFRLDEGSVVVLGPMVPAAAGTGPYPDLILTAVISLGIDAVQRVLVAGDNCSPARAPEPDTSDEPVTVTDTW